jgi:hypothetical protein
MFLTVSVEKPLPRDTDCLLDPYGYKGEREEKEEAKNSDMGL